MALQYINLIGGSQLWDPALWIASDDTVRGGRSFSNLTIASDTATFSGFLDKDSLGGAGFASQRTKGSLDWDLAEWDGLLLSVALSDGKLYTLTVKDVLPENDTDSSLLYERNFTLPAGAGEGVKLSWSGFVPTLRGRTQPDAKPLDMSSIKRLSIMMRSYFGEQEGLFNLTLNSIGAFRSPGTGYA